MQPQQNKTALRPVSARAEPCTGNVQMSQVFQLLPCTAACVAVKGFALVVFLFAFRLTLATGTINGLIFYANIIHNSRTLFFPNGNTNILTLFIAWLNMDLGYETCFYNGMDTYAMTWLQFAFPLYVWVLCGFIVFVSSKSYRVSRILGTNQWQC